MMDGFAKSLERRSPFHPIRVALFLAGSAFSGFALYWAHLRYEHADGLKLIDLVFIGGVLMFGVMMAFGDHVLKYADRIVDYIVRIFQAVRGK